MKTTFKPMLALFAGMLTMASCSNDDILSDNMSGNKKNMTFSASTEGSETTRSSIDGFKVKWTAGDEISVFDGTSNNKFTLSDGAGTTVGTFTGEAEEGSQVYYAVYPFLVDEFTPTEDDAKAALGDYASYFDEFKNVASELGEEQLLSSLSSLIGSKNAGIVTAYYYNKSVTTPHSLNGNTITNIELSNVQTVEEGEFVDPAATLMVAASTSAGSFNFKNLVSYIAVTPTVDCEAISVTGNSDDDVLAGTGTVTISDEPTFELTSGGSNTVTLTGTIKAGKTYYIAVLPSTLASGIRIDFAASKTEVYSSELTSSFTLKRSYEYNGGSNTGDSYAIAGTDNEHEWNLTSYKGTKWSLGAYSSGSNNSTFDGAKQSVIDTYGENWSLPTDEDAKHAKDKNNGIFAYYYSSASSMFKKSTWTASGSVYNFDTDELITENPECDRIYFVYKGK